MPECCAPLVAARCSETAVSVICWSTMWGELLPFSDSSCEVFVIVNAEEISFMSDHLN